MAVRVVRRRLLFPRVVPVVVVAAVGGATVAVDERHVGAADARVDARDDDALTARGVGPHQGCPNELNVPHRCVQVGVLAGRADDRGVDGGNDLVGGDLDDVRKPCQALHKGGRRIADVQGVVDPAHAGVDTLGLKGGDQATLEAVSVRYEFAVDHLQPAVVVEVCQTRLGCRWTDRELNKDVHRGVMCNRLGGQGVQRGKRSRSDGEDRSKKNREHAHVVF